MDTEAQKQKERIMKGVELHLDLQSLLAAI